MDLVCANWRETGELYRDPQELQGKLAEVGADVLITEGDMVDEEVLAGSGLTIIGVCRGHVDNVDIAAATARGIPVFHAPDRNSSAVAEHTVALILAVYRRLTASDRLLKSGGFFVDSGEQLARLYREFRGRELRGKTVGIVGLGSIGSRVARILRFGFDCTILVHDPYASDQSVAMAEARRVALPALLAESDVVTLHAKVTAETMDLIGAAELALMKPASVLINTARAALMDEDALQAALEEKRISGAGLDVFGSEPVDSDNRFLHLDNVVVTPHIGGSTDEQELRQSEMIAGDIERYLSGDTPRHICNPEVLLRKAP
jgi:D-3-phosphoglycerate dehydrogenase